MTRAAVIASRAALAVILAATFLRALVAFEPFPYWSGDPTLINIPMTSLGPAGSLLIDSISLFAAAVILFTEPLLARRILWLPFTLVGIGAIGVILHGWLLSGPSLDNIRIGAGWTAALFGALAAAHAARDAHTARLIAASSIGLIAILAAKGFMQVFVEHADNVSLYTQNKDAFLASQGWTPGSAAALSFERRLTQPEATAWFGLANVVASFAAASLTALLGWTILAWRETRTADQRLPSGWSGLLTIGTLLAAATLYFSGAKGGYAAAALGIALLAIAALLNGGGRASSPTSFFLARAKRLAAFLPLALIAAALGALILRGLLGERLGELSLLFRWFYISTAARIFAIHPLTGIGPANFQDAYQLLKPATSPEEVTSPHSVLFDFTSTLGLFGAAFAGAFLLWAAQCGKSLFRPTGSFSGSAAAEPRSDLESHAPRSDLWFLLFASATPVLLAAWIEGPIASPDSTLMRLVGLAAWVGIALASLAVMRLTDSWRIPFAAAAIVLAVHGQIEVTPIWPGSCALYFLILAAASEGIGDMSVTPPRRLSGLIPSLACLAISIALIPAAVIPAWRWQESLHRAFDAFINYADFRSRLTLLEQGARPPTGDSLERLNAAIRASIPADRRSQPPSFARDLTTAFDIASTFADANLRNGAVAIYPRHHPTISAASRLCLQYPAFELAGVHPFAASTDWADRAESLARLATDASPTSAGVWGWLGTLLAARYDMDHDRTHLEEAVAAWTHATTLDPHGISLSVRLMHAYLELGQPEQARLWAGRALQANADLHLDPVRQLSDPELAEVRRIAAPP